MLAYRAGLYGIDMRLISSLISASWRRAGGVLRRAEDVAGNPRWRGGRDLHGLPRILPQGKVLTLRLDRTSPVTKVALDTSCCGVATAVTLSWVDEGNVLSMHARGTRGDPALVTCSQQCRHALPLQRAIQPIMKQIVLITAAWCLLLFCPHLSSASSDALEQQLLQAARELQGFMVGVRRCAAGVNGLPALLATSSQRVLYGPLSTRTFHGARVLHCAVHD